MSRFKLSRFLPLFAVAASLNAAVPNAAAPVRVHGGTVLVRSKLHATIFLVRNGEGDGPAEHAFQVWTNPGLDLNAVYRGADVEYTGTALVVVAPGEKSVTVYTVAGHSAPAAASPEGFSAATYAVAGLNHVIGANVEKLTITTSRPGGRLGTNECTDCDWLPFEDPWGGGGGAAGCNAGGSGSTSCSVTQGGSTCSVSCGVNYYACCRFGPPPSCSCVAF
jgi:hypothetical protein